MKNIAHDSFMTDKKQLYSDEKNYIWIIALVQLLFFQISYKTRYKHENCCI